MPGTLTLVGTPIGNLSDLPPRALAALEACDFIAAHFPGVQVMQPQGTYMLFLDCAAWLQEHHMTLRELEERGARAGVIWQDGAAFAWPDSIRMNLALPHSRLVEAMEHLRVHAFC